MSSILHDTIYETAPIKVAKNEFLHLPKNIGRVWSPKFATGLNVICNRHTVFPRIVSSLE